MPDAVAELQSYLAGGGTSPVDDLQSYLTRPVVSAAPTEDELAVIRAAPPNRPAFSLQPAQPPSPAGFEPPHPIDAAFRRTVVPAIKAGVQRANARLQQPSTQVPYVDAIDALAAAVGLPEPSSGVSQAGRGVKNLVTGEGGRMNAASDVIEGAMTAGQPLMVAAGIEEPLVAARALAVGMAGQEAAKRGTGYLGLSPAAQRLAGNVGALTAPAAVEGGFALRRRGAQSPEVPASVSEGAVSSPPAALDVPAPEPAGPTLELRDPREPLVEQTQAVSEVSPKPEAQPLGADVVDRIREKLAAGEPLGSQEARDALAERQRVEDVRKEAPKPAAEPEPVTEPEPVAEPEPEDRLDRELKTPFEYATKDTRVAHLSPEHLRELRAIYHEMDAMPYTPTTWTDLRNETGLGGNAAGGHMQRTAGKGGASVYGDIYQMSPGKSLAKRELVKAQIDAFIGGGKPTQAAIGAINIARARLEGRSHIPGDGELSRPELPSHIAGEIPTPVERQTRTPVYDEATGEWHMSDEGNVTEPVGPEASDNELDDLGDNDLEDLGDWFRKQAAEEAGQGASPVDELRHYMEGDHAVQEPSPDEGRVRGGTGTGDEVSSPDLGARDAEPQEPADARLGTEAAAPLGREEAESDVRTQEPATATAARAVASSPVDELRELLDKQPITIEPTQRVEDWGTIRNQQRGAGGTKSPQVDVTLQGRKTYTNKFGNLPDYEANKTELGYLEPHAADAYLRARSHGLNHDDAMRYVYDVDARDATAESPTPTESENPIMDLARAISEAPKVAEVPFSLSGEAADSGEVQSDLFKPEKPSFGKWQAMQLPPKPERSGGFQSTLVPGAKEFAEQDLAPIAQGGKNAALEVRNKLSPQTASDNAQESADVVRRAKARIANADAVEQYRMAKVTKAFAKQSDEANIANIAEYERTGQFANAPEGYSEFYKKSMTQAGRLLERAYGRNVVGRVENYVRRAFKFGSQADEVKGTDYLTTKLNSLSANKSPLKGRVLDMPLDEALADMRARGINVKLATTNPELLRQWSIGNARQAIAYREAWDDLKGRGLVRYVRSFTRPPEGMVPLEDRVATVFKSPLLPVDEARDASVMEGLNGVAEKLGVRLSRSVKLEGAPRSAGGGQVWGLSGPGNRVQTKFAGSESILAHEIGHQIDDQFGLWNKLRALETQYKAEGYEGWSLAKQLRAVTDLTWEGQQEPPDTYQRYNRSAPEKMANLVSAYVHAPEKLKKVAPDVFNVFDELVDTTPALQGLREIEPGIRLVTNQGEVHAGGHVVAGKYYATPDVARILNNTISTGFENSPTFRGLRAMNNSMNQIQLGLSGFHATGTAINAGVSDLALGVRKIGRGDFAGGTAAVARSVVPGASFVRDLWKGRALIEGLKRSDPASYAVLNDVINPSGARLRIEQRYQNQAVENMRSAFANGNYLGALGRAPLALIEATSKPLMQYAIPRVKLGALLDLAADITARNPGNLDQIARARELAKASDSIDNRFGQLAYDNLFWKKTTTDLAQLATRSVGWNLGTVRELGGGAMDVRKLAKGEVTDRLLYTAALPLYVGMIGAAYHYLHTGKGPQEMKDYFYPKNGRTEPNGMESRTTLPTYMKDVEAYGVPEYLQGKLQEGVGKTMATLGHKQSPLLEFSRDLVANEDYFGDMIRNPDDPAMRQLEQVGTYALKGIMPFSVQQFGRSKDENATPEGKAESFMGFVKAPATMERTPAETLMHSFIGPQPSRTPEQVDKSNLKRELRDDVKKGDTAAAREIIDRGELGRRQVMGAAKTANLSGLQSGFKKLTLDQAIRVYEVATPKQRGALRPLLSKKVQALRDAAPEDMADLQQRLTKAGSLPYAPPPIMAALQPGQ